MPSVKRQKAKSSVTFKIYSSQRSFQENKRKKKKKLAYGLFLHYYLLFSRFTQMFQKDTLVKVNTQV